MVQVHPTAFMNRTEITMNGIIPTHVAAPGLTFLDGRTPRGPRVVVPAKCFPPDVPALGAVTVYPCAPSVFSRHASRRRGVFVEVIA